MSTMAGITMATARTVSRMPMMKMMGRNSIIAPPRNGPAGAAIPGV
jgi:hypothetical protein